MTMLLFVSEASTLYWVKYSMLSPSDELVNGSDPALVQSRLDIGRHWEFEQMNAHGFRLQSYIICPRPDRPSIMCLFFYLWTDDRIQNCCMCVVLGVHCLGSTSRQKNYAVEFLTFLFKFCYFCKKMNYLMEIFFYIWIFMEYFQCCAPKGQIKH